MVCPSTLLVKKLNIRENSDFWKGYVSHKYQCLCDMSHNSIFREITFQCQKAIWLTSYPPLCVTICHSTCSWRKEVWIWRPSNTLAINCKFTKKNLYHICLNCNSNIWQDIILSGIFHRGAVPPESKKVTSPKFPRGRLKKSDLNSKQKNPSKVGVF